MIQVKHHRTNSTVTPWFCSEHCPVWGVATLLIVHVSPNWGGGAIFRCTEYCFASMSAVNRSDLRPSGVWYNGCPAAGVFVCVCPARGMTSGGRCWGERLRAAMTCVCVCVCVCQCVCVCLSVCLSVSLSLSISLRRPFRLDLHIQKVTHRLEWSLCGWRHLDEQHYSPWLSLP